MTDDSARQSYMAALSVLRSQPAGRATDQALDAAEVHFRAAIDVGDGEWSVRASAELGDLLWQRGRAADAAHVLRVALDAGHPDHTPMALIVEGVMAAARGDTAGAELSYRSAVATGRGERVSHAWFNLGTLYQQDRRYGEAVTAFRSAVAGGHREYAARAGVNLGYVLFNHLGDRAGATRAFQAVVATGHPEQSRLATTNLDAMSALAAAGPAATVMGEPDDVSVGRGGGTTQYRTWATDWDPTDDVLGDVGGDARAAAERLAVGLQRLVAHDPAGAEDVFRREGEAGNRAGYLYLAAMRRSLQDAGGSQAALALAAGANLLHAMRAGGQPMVISAANGVLTGRGTNNSHAVGALESLHEQARLAESEFVAQVRKLMTGGTESAAATDAYAWHMMQLGRMDEASRYFEDAFHRLDRAMRLRTAVEYGWLLAITGDDAGARRLWGEVQHSGHPEHEPAATVLGIRHAQGTLMFATRTARSSHPPGDRQPSPRPPVPPADVEPPADIATSEGDAAGLAARLRRLFRR